MPISVTRLSSVRLASSLFQSTFASRPAVAATAPGRVNLIGEHTDYNGGPVLPLAVERRTAVLAAREDGWFFVSALDGVVRGVEIEAPMRRHWTDYLVGVVRELRVLGAAPAGARIAVASTVPAGAGLSSSAALTVAAAKALSLLAGRRLTPAQLVDVAYRAEHDQVGVALRPDGSDHRRPRRAGDRAPVRDGERRDPTGAVHRPGVDRGDRAWRTGWSAARSTGGGGNARRRWRAAERCGRGSGTCPISRPTICGPWRPGSRPSWPRGRGTW